MTPEVRKIIGQRPQCSGNVTDPSTVAYKRRDGVPLSCARRAFATVNGRPLCRGHAGHELLTLMLAPPSLGFGSGSRDVTQLELIQARALEVVQTAGDPKVGDLAEAVHDLVKLLREAEAQAAVDEVTQPGDS